LLAGSALAASAQAPPNQAPGKRPNVVILMTDDTGWNDFGAYSGGGAALGHPTPNIDRIGREGAVFTNWYGQASCTAGRASFITGRIPICSALSIAVAPATKMRCERKRRRLPNSSSETATRPTSRASGISATSRNRIRSSTASTR
jgi:hypothetical protein